MVQELALALHIATGALALGLGPLAVYAARRRGPGTRLDGAYHFAVLAVAASAALLAALDWSRLWWFLPIAAGSYGLALLGYAAGRRGRRRLYVHGQGGSYIALVTALLVVSVGSPVAWVAPTLIGSPLIQLVARLVSRPEQAKPSAHSGRSRVVSRGLRDLVVDRVEIMRRARAVARALPGRWSCRPR